MVVFRAGKGLISVHVVPPLMVLYTAPLFPETYPTVLLVKKILLSVGAFVPTGNPPITCHDAPLLIDLMIFEVRLAAATLKALEATTITVSLPKATTS
jgi:hypothetical protein